MRFMACEMPCASPAERADKLRRVLFCTPRRAPVRTGVSASGRPGKVGFEHAPAHSASHDAKRTLPLQRKSLMRPRVVAS